MGKCLKIILVSVVAVLISFPVLLCAASLPEHRVAYGGEGDDLVVNVNLRSSNRYEEASGPVKVVWVSTGGRPDYERDDEQDYDVGYDWETYEFSFAESVDVDPDGFTGSGKAIVYVNDRKVSECYYKGLSWKRYVEEDREGLLE